MLASALSLLISSSAVSIAGNAAVSQEKYAELAEQFDAVGGLGGMGTGTLVGEQWVITAAHVADFLRLQGVDSITFELADGREFVVDQVIIHPDWTPLEVQMANRGEDDPMTPGDLALLHLAEPVTGIAPMPMAAFDEANPEVMLVGIGSFLNDPENGMSGRTVMSMERGVNHAGTNRVFEIDEERNEIKVDFTKPGEEGATEFEAVAFAGDSGGPFLTKTDNGWAIIGVIGMVDSENDVLGDYDDKTHATSLGGVQAWIDAQMAE